ncbi:hypothetical protein PYCC9005_002893 [Savitreella phatthalungensis]
MVFSAQIVKTAGPIPDDVSVAEWMFANRSSQGCETALIDTKTGEKRSWQDVILRSRELARALAHSFGKSVGDVQVYGFFAPNLMDVPSAIWAAHLLGGTVSGMNPAYTTPEVQYQLGITGAIALFTCKELLPVARPACEPKGIHIILLDGEETGCLSIAKMYELGKTLPELPRWTLATGEGRRRLAFLSFSSGTTGKPKGVMISHYNVIANTLQNTTFYQVQGNERKISLGLLPFYHIYGLIVILHTELHIGNTIALMAKFDLEPFLDAATKYRIQKMCLVPPIIVRLTKDPLVKRHTAPLQHVDEMFCGAAPLAPQLMQDMRDMIKPGAIFRQGYGMTETCTTTTIIHHTDQWDGSAGVIIPDVLIKLVDAEGREVTDYDTPGEIWAKSPAVTLGYFKNQTATDECYIDGWLRTGDEAVVRKSPRGYEHVFIVDRLKELIK